MKARAIALLMVLTGCVWTEKRPTVVVPPSAPVKEAPAAALAVPPKKPPPPAAPEPTEALPEETRAAPSIRLEEVQGATPEEAGVIFSKATEPLELCGPSAGGVFRVHFDRKRNRTTFRFDPKTMATEQARECVLQALSISEADETIENARDPSERLQYVQSLLIIS